MNITPQSTSVFSFRDALGIAFELDDGYPGRSQLISISADGTVGSIVEIDNSYPTGEIERFLDRAERRWLLTSSVPYPINPIRQSQMAWFSFLCTLAQIKDKPFLDWIVVDGQDAQSFAYLMTPETAWIDDPADRRQQDYLNMSADYPATRYDKDASTGSSTSAASFRTRSSENTTANSRSTPMTINDDHGLQGRCHSNHNAAIFSPTNMRMNPSAWLR